MRLFIFLLLLMQVFYVFSKDCNMIILLDRDQKETVVSEEVNLMHQLISSLQQKAGVVVVSSSLLKNIKQRKRNFELSLKKSLPAALDLVRLYNDVNDTASCCHGSLSKINRDLDENWYSKRYSRLKKLSDSQMHQLKFNFYCWKFFVEGNFWQQINAGKDLSIFIPKNMRADFNIKNLGTSQSLLDNIFVLLDQKNISWSVYLAGHGHLAQGNQQGVIAGLTVGQFSQLLQFLQDYVDVKFLLYASCYAGGRHTVEPYQDIKLKFPVIVFSSTDSPTYVFGNVSGCKLPPYGQYHYLLSGDLNDKHQLQVSSTIDFHSLQNLFYNGQIQAEILKKLSPFYYCDNFNHCSIEKVENYPLIRFPGQQKFELVSGGVMDKLAHEVRGQEVVVSDKAMLLYSKMVKKIICDRDDTFPLISMLPGIHSHCIKEIDAHRIGFKKMIFQMFFGVDDAHLQKSFFIDALYCIDDLTDAGGMSDFSDVMVIHEQGLMPSFVGNAQSIVVCQHKNQSYVLIYYQGDLVDIMILNEKQKNIVGQIKQFLLQSVEYEKDQEDKLLTFDSYRHNQLYQASIIKNCQNQKICF